MSKLCLLLLVIAVLVITGCGSTKSGSQEFIPGKGWVPVK
jgi:hypothetical protein